MKMDFRGVRVVSFKLLLKLLTLAAALLSVANTSALAASLTSGQIVVGNSNYFSGCCSELLETVDPITGMREVIPQSGSYSVRFVQDLALESTGGILFIDPTVGPDQIGAMFRVSPEAGTRVLVSNFGLSAQGPLGMPRALDVDSSGSILVATLAQYLAGSMTALMRVSSQSGNRTLISDFSDASLGPVVDSPAGIAISSDNRVLVVNTTSGWSTGGTLVFVDASTGTREILSDFGDSSQGPTGVYIKHAAFAADGSILVVDSDAGTNGSGVLFRVDAITGQRTVVSDFGDLSLGLDGMNPSDVAIEPDGDVLVIDPQVSAQSDSGLLFRVDPISGQRKVLSGFRRADQGPGMYDPAVLAIVE